MATATSVSNSPAIAGFVCSVLGIVLFSMVLPPLVLGPAGIILGRQGRALARRGAEHGSLATAAIVLGIIALVLFTMLLVVFFAGMQATVGSGTIEVSSPMPVR